MDITFKEERMVFFTSIMKIICGFLLNNLFMLIYVCAATTQRQTDVNSDVFIDLFILIHYSLTFGLVSGF